MTDAVILKLHKTSHEYGAGQQIARIGQTCILGTR